MPEEVPFKLGSPGLCEAFFALAGIILLLLTDRIKGPGRVQPLLLANQESCRKVNLYNLFVMYFVVTSS